MTDKMNAMQTPRIEKLTLNIGAGKDQVKLEKGVTLLKHITGIDPVKTVTNKRIPNWGLRPGLPIGCKLTMRKQKAKDLIRRLLEAKKKTLVESQFDNFGNISFGVQEYIDIPGVAYKPELGVLGLQVCITLEKPGFRIKKRAFLKKEIGKKHLITKANAIDFMKKEFGINVVEKEGA
jgi:large subunit ribosomal protein L5